MQACKGLYKSRLWLGGRAFARVPVRSLGSIISAQASHFGFVTRQFKDEPLFLTISNNAIPRHYPFDIAARVYSRYWPVRDLFSPYIEANDTTCKHVLNLYPIAGLFCSEVMRGATPRENTTGIKHYPTSPVANGNFGTCESTCIPFMLCTIQVTFVIVLCRVPVPRSQTKKHVLT